MQNKRRFVVFAIFVLCMFFLMTFAGGANNDAIATRDVEFVDGFDNSTISLQKVEVGKDAEVPEDPKHENYVFAGWFLYEDHDIRVTDFEEIMEDLKVIALYAGDLNNNGIADEDDEYYTVTFIDSLTNNVIKEQEVLAGLDASAPTAPNHTGYTFTGWSRGYTNVQSDLTVNALYRNIPATTYEVTFIDGDTEEVIDVQTIEEGKAATLPNAPKHDDRVFDHWDGDYTNITANTTITAIYKDDKNNDGIADDTQPHYTVTYEDYDGTELEVFEEVLVDIKTPIIDEPKREYYKFTGWAPAVAETVTDNATYTATYKPLTDENNDNIADEEQDKFTIIYVDYNDETLEKFENQVVNKTTPTIANPTRKYYEFTGWEPAVAETVTDNATYKATYKPINDVDKDGIADEEENKYTVTYKLDNDSDEVYKTYTNLVDGIATPVPEENPDKEYAVFEKWNPAIAETVTADTTYYATWLEDKDNDNKADKDEAKYIVIYEVDGKEVAKYENLVDGISTPTIANPDKEYAVFGGWNPEVAKTVTKNVTYKATWLEDKDNDNKADEEENKFTVTYVVDGENYKVYENQVEGIKTPIPEENPDKEYAVFGGWTPNPEGTTVTKDQTYEVVWLADENNDNIDDATQTKYTVVYKDYNDEVYALYENQVEGKVTPIPEEPTREYYEFTGWTPNPEGTTVTSHASYKATYEPYNDVDGDDIADEEENKYTVTYVVDGENYKVYENQLEGIKTPIPEENPDKEYAVFGGWTPNPEGTTVTKDQTYKATWLEDKDNDNKADKDEAKFTVTYVVDGENYKVYENQVEGIKTPIPEENPTKTYYEFKGWTPNPEGTTVTKNQTYEAKFMPNNDVNNDGIADELQKRIIFKDYNETELFNNLVTIGENIEDYIPTVPTRNYYTFAGWNPKAEGKVIEDKVYTATYTPVNDTNNDGVADEEQRRIIFKNYDGTELLNKLVTLGEKTPTPETNPTKNEYYEFVGWNPSVAATVTADATYTANYKALEDKNNDNIADQEQTLWEVRFYGFGGATQIGEVQYVVDGTAAVAPTAPAVSGYRFDGWLQDFSNVKSNLNVIANYTDIESPYINPNVILYNYDSDAEGYLNANITATVTDNSGVVVEVRYIKGEATATDYESATVMSAAADGTYQINGITKNTVYTILAKDAAGNISAVPVEVEGITYKESSGTFEDLYATGTFGGVTGNFLIGPYYRKIDVTTKSNVKIVDARYVVTSGWDSYKKASDFADPNYGNKLEHTNTTLSSNIQTGVLNKLTVYIKYEKTVEVAPNVYETHTEEKVYTAFMSMIWG